MTKKYGLTPFQFSKIEPNMRKKDELTNPFPFFQKEPKMIKKDGLTPFHFL